MKSLSLLTIENKLILFMALAFSIAVVGDMFPYRFPLVGFIILSTSIYIFISNRGNIVLFNRAFLTLYILELMYFIALWRTHEFFGLTLNDIKNIFILNLFIINMLNAIKTKSDLSLFLRYIKNTVFVAGIIVAIIGLGKFILLINGHEIAFFVTYGGDYPIGTSLVNEYNLFALGLIMSMMFGYQIFLKSDSLIVKLFTLNSIILIIMAVVLSASRRSLIIMALIFLVLFIKSIFPKYKFNRNFFKNKFSYILLFIFLIMGLAKSNINIEELINSKAMEMVSNRAQTISTANQDEGSFSPRVKRIEYSIELFDDYTLSEMLFGKDFYYIRLFTFRFDPTGREYEDSPHNYIFSHLLFSGLIGVVILLVFYFQVIKLFIQYISVLKEIFLYFIISTIYMLISSNSIFSTKTYLIVMFTPIIFSIINSKKKDLYKDKICVA